LTSRQNDALTGGKAYRSLQGRVALRVRDKKTAGVWPAASKFREEAV